MRERINFKKVSLLTKISLAIIALIFIALIAGIVKFFNVALEKEAKDKDTERVRLIDKDIIKPL